MKRVIKSVLGVTLLEVMLVLAIAAMIIVMSVRYYQSASASQQANSTLQTIQSITAAADSLAQGGGSYVAATTATLQTLMPNDSLQDAWGGTIKISAQAATKYTITFALVPAQVCTIISTNLKSNPKFTALSACGVAGSAAFAYTYVSTN